MRYDNPAKRAFFKGLDKREKYSRAMRDGRRTAANRENARYQAKARMLALDVLAAEADFHSAELMTELAGF